MENNDINFLRVVNSSEVIRTQYRIGDIVKVTWTGQTYSSYSIAWKILYPNYRNLNNFDSRYGQLRCQTEVENGHNVWRVYDIGLHRNHPTVILFLVNTISNIGVAIGQEGCELLFHTRKSAIKPYYRLDQDSLEIIQNTKKL